MIVGSDLSWLNGAPRPGDARSYAERGANRTDGAGAANAAVDGRAAIASVQRVMPAQSAKPQNEMGARNPQERENDARRFAREAPLGERPRYIPKGQMLNVLV